MRTISSLVSFGSYVAQNGRVWATKDKSLHTKCIFLQCSLNIFADRNSLAFVKKPFHQTNKKQELNKDSQIKMGDGSVTVWTMDMLFDLKRQECKIFCNYPAFFTHLRLDCRALTSLRKLVAQ